MTGLNPRQKRLARKVGELERRWDALEARIGGLGWGDAFEAAREELMSISDQLHRLYAEAKDMKEEKREGR